MNALDYAILGIYAVSLLIGVWRGAIREIMNVVGWVIAFIAAQAFAHRGAPPKSTNRGGISSAVFQSNIRGKSLHAIGFLGGMTTPFRGCRRGGHFDTAVPSSKPAKAAGCRILRIGVIVLSVQIDTHDVNTLNEIKMLRKRSDPQ